jgi:hypothetical protein
MDKNQLKLLLDSAEGARKLRDQHRFDSNTIEAIQRFNSQIPSMARQIAESLPKIDLSIFVKSIQFTLPDFDYSQFIPKIDYSQLIKNYDFPLPKIDSLVLAKVYASQITSLQKIALDFARIHAVNLTKIRANAFLMSSSIESLINITALSNSFAVELASTIYRIIENSENDENNFSEFEHLIENKVKEQPNSKAGLDLIVFILTFLSFLVGSGQLYYAKLQYEDAKQSSEINDQRYSELLKILNRIAENLDEKSKNNKTSYIVQRTIGLKVKPKFKSNTIAVLYPNQQIQLVESSHKWVYVEYFDYLDGIPKYGWASKKYLVKIEKSK